MKTATVIKSTGDLVTTVEAYQKWLQDNDVKIYNVVSIGGSLIITHDLPNTPK